MRKIALFLIGLFGLAIHVRGADGTVLVIDKIAPKNGAFVGVVDSSQTVNNVTNFNGNLSSADDTVQKALDTLDNLSVSGGGGSGVSALAVATGTASGFVGTISTPTAVINFNSSQFTGTLGANATAFISMNQVSLSSGVTGSLPAASVAAGSLGASVLASSFPISGVTAGSYINTNLTVNAQGIITAASNGSGGSGGSSTLAVADDGVVVSSPTVAIDVVGLGLEAHLSGSTTAQLRLIAGSTHYIQNSSTLQSGATFHVAVGTVAGPFYVTGADATFNVSQLRMTDGHGMYWGDTSVYGYDAAGGSGPRVRFDINGSERIRATASGLVASRGQMIADNDIDSTLEVYTDGEFSRPGINVVTVNSNTSEAPVLLLENQDAPQDNGTAIGFYSTGTQQGIIGFSWVGASTNTAKMQIYLQSGGNSVPVIKALSSGATGYPYFLVGAPHIHNPGATLHVASDNGDVDSGIRIERGAGDARYNFFIDSSGNLKIREVDVTGFPITIAKGTGKATFANTITGSLGASVSTFTITSLTSKNCLGTDSSGNVQEGSCGGGGSGTSTLEVFSNFDATRSSPTASISVGDSLKLSVTGSTAVVAVDFSSVTSRSDVILLQNTLQTGATFYVSSGAVNGLLSAGSLNVTAGVVDVASGGLSLTVGADSAASTRTNNTTKLGRIAGYHYTNAEEPVGMVIASNDSTDNVISVGGGSALVNAATVVRMYTAANSTTTTGSERMRITSSGNVGVNTTNPTSRFDVVDGSVTIRGTAAALIIAPLNCSGNANGGALTTDANGLVSCSDDDSGSATDPLTVSTLTIVRQLKIPATSTHTASSIGLVAIDTNAISNTGGTMVFHDGTNQYFVVATTETPTDGQVVQYRSANGFASWESILNASNTITQIFRPETAKLPGTNPCIISNSTTSVFPMLLCDASTDESATWISAAKPLVYGSSLTAYVFYTMASATSGNVVLDFSVMAVSDGDAADVDTESFASVNSVTKAVPGTAGHLDVAVIPITNHDSLTLDDLAAWKINRDANNGSDTATGDIEIRMIVIAEPDIEGGSGSGGDCGECVGGGATERDLYLSASAGLCQLTTGCVDPDQYQTLTTSTAYVAAGFLSGTTSFWQSSWTLPDDYEDGSTFQAILEWTSTATTTSTTWHIDMKAVSDDDSLDSAWGTAVSVADATTAVGDLMRTATTGAITAAGSPVSGDRLFVRVYRGDSSGDARFAGIQLKYQLD